MRILPAALVILSAPAIVSACDVAPFFDVVEYGATLTSAQVEGDCVFAAHVPPATGPGSRVAAVTLHRLPSAKPVRVSFRIDTSGISLQNILEYVEILRMSAVGPTVAGELSRGRLLTASISGTSGAPQLVVFGACSEDSAPCVGTKISLSSSVNVLRFEHVPGPAGVGDIRYWVNADFDAAPSGSVAATHPGFDNAAWGGVAAIAAGVLLSIQAQGTAAEVVIDQLSTSVDSLFWSDLESASL